MNITVEQDVNLDEELAKAKELLNIQKELADNAKMLRFVTIREMSEVTGWSMTTVQRLFNRPDFPSCDFGKEKVAEINAVVRYFSVPRRR